MRKKILTGAAILCALLFGACGDGKTAEQFEKEAGTSADVSASSDSETLPEAEEAENEAEEPAEEAWMIRIDTLSGYYTEDLQLHYVLEGNWPEDTKVYYTLDGQDPEETEEMRLDDAGIYLTALPALQVIPVKLLAVATGADGEEAVRTCFGNYVLCSDAEKFPDLPVVCLTTDDENLYDYDTGIFVPGRVYDESDTSETGYHPGNYSMRTDDWIRDAQVTILSTDGSVLTEDQVGLGVSGNTSAATEEIRSLKISAKAEYGSTGKISCKFTADGLNSADWSFVSEETSLKLRAGSQDLEHGNLRSAVVSRICAESGFEGCTDTERCLVYLNGSLYGLFDMQQSYSGQSLADKFSLPDSSKVEVWQSCEEAVFAGIGDVGDLFQTDLNDPANRAALEEVVDMEDYLLYYAIEILCNNTDWPQNNFRIWRYTGTEIPGNEYTDGRLRFLIYDMDYSFVSEMIGEPFEGSLADTLRSIMQNENRGYNSCFVNCMQSTYYRDLFASYICDLLNTSMSPENVERIILEEDAKVQNARDLVETLHESWGNETAEQFVSEMISVYQNRPAEVRPLMQEFMNLDEETCYTFCLTTDTGTQVSFSNQTVYENSMYSVSYYADAQITLTAACDPGYEFSHWLVNGSRKEGDTLTITPGDVISDGIVNVIAVSEKKHAADLVIDRVVNRGSCDTVTLLNAGEEPVSLNGLYLTDKVSKPTRTGLPDLVLEPGGELTLYAADDPEAPEDAYKFDFGLSTGEVLYLSDGTGLIDSVFVPETAEGEYYGRLNHGADWKYIRE